MVITTQLQIIEVSKVLNLKLSSNKQYVDFPREFGECSESVTFPKLENYHQTLKELDANVSG